LTAFFLPRPALFRVFLSAHHGGRPSAFVVLTLTGSPPRCGAPAFPLFPIFRVIKKARQAAGFLFSQ